LRVIKQFGAFKARPQVAAYRVLEIL